MPRVRCAEPVPVSGSVFGGQISIKLGDARLTEVEQAVVSYLSLHKGSEVELLAAKGASLGPLIVRWPFLTEECSETHE